MGVAWRLVGPSNLTTCFGLQVAREPMTKEEEVYHDLVFDKMLDKVDLVLETSEQQLEADRERRYVGMSPSEEAGHRFLSSSQHR
jgi:hypothetical protein